MRQLDAARAAIRARTLAREPVMVTALIDDTGLDRAARGRISARAEALVRRVRAAARPSMMEAFLAEYGLSTREGVALMCLAEAMLRVPDAATMDDLVSDKIAPHDWGAHLGDSGSILVNASTWALMLTGRVLDADAEPGVAASLRGAVRRLGEPVIRTAVHRAMRQLGAQFVLGRDIDEALARAAKLEARGYRYSYDMLGEAARTEADARRHLDDYHRAIARLAERARPGALHDNPGISIKLSALHPRFETAKRATTEPVLVERTLALARAAKDAGITFNVDAEEMERVEVTLDVVEAVLRDPSLAGWEGGLRAGGAGLRPARAGGRGLARRARRRARPPPDRPARQGCVLGRRDQAGAGAGSRRLRRLHAQEPYRRRLSRLRAGAPRPPPPALPSVRHPQRPHRRGDPGARRRRPRRLRVPAPARHGRGAARAAARGRGPAVAHLRPGRRARGSPGLPRATPVGERRQQLLRPPTPRRERAAGGDRPGPDRRDRGGRGASAPEDRAPARALRPRAGQRPRLRSRRCGDTGRRRRGPPALLRPPTAGVPHRWWPERRRRRRPAGR